MALRSHRSLRHIETELLRTLADRRGPQAARPLLGAGQVITAWNELLSTAEVKGVGTTGPEQEEDGSWLLRAYRSLPLGLALTNSDGQILRSNPAFELLLNSGDAPRTSSIRDWLRLEQLSEEASRFFSGARCVSLQLKLGSQLADGVLRVTRSRLDGRPDDAPGLLWIVEDITQGAIAAAARDQFLATATHELRTPLSNLRAYAEALVCEAEIDIEVQREFCNTINNECVRLARLVDQLLAVDQLEAGSLVVAQGDVDLARVIREAVDYIRSAADSKQQSISLDVSPKLAMVVGDKDKLQAMLVNLLGNAVKYTQVGGAVQLSASPASGNRIELAVSDNGPGIASEDLTKIFDKFYRSRNASIAAENGNGLGLTFAREIARLHGGDITVESKLGEGSRFVVTLHAKPVPVTT
jgi:signal transduction histidine kinase